MEATLKVEQALRDPDDTSRLYHTLVESWDIVPLTSLPDAQVWLACEFGNFVDLDDNGSKGLATVKGLAAGTVIGRFRFLFKFHSNK